MKNFPVFDGALKRLLWSDGHAGCNDRNQPKAKTKFSKNMRTRPAGGESSPLLIVLVLLLVPVLSLSSFLFILSLSSGTNGEKDKDKEERER
jgi:hypothetical protein